MAVKDRAAPVRVDVLGSLRLLVDGQVVEVRGPKRRAVLALLAVAQGRAVTVEHLLDALWPVDLPESARGALHSHVFRLRGHLGPAGHRLETLDGAYRLALGPDDLDAARARTLLAEARTLARTDPAAAGELLRQVRGLWRGPALAEFAEVSPLAAAATGLGHLHREATDLLITCALDADRPDGVVALAAEVLAADPLREPAVLQLMRALAATGQAARALAAARDFRRRLAEETGLDPSAELAALEQAIADGQAAPAPTANRRPVRSTERPATPARPVTPLIGRDSQVSALQRLLASERLVTVVGPGGVGKTRVALELAGRTDTVTVLYLAPLTEAGGIPHVLAEALGLRVVQGDVLAACAAQLGAGPAVLVVDNCEHLIDAVRDLVSTLLSTCPELTVLATSREPLGLPGECPSRLAPLALPGDGAGAGLARVPSVAVFLDRAARVRPGFDPDGPELRLVADVVRHLDGVPLAIELAAGRMSTFSLTELAQRLDRSLDLLGGGRPTGQERHRTLRATVEWSYQLLPDDERRLFRNLGVFVDGFDLAAAEAVAARLHLGVDPGSALAHLVDASMVDASFPPGGARYRMLETLRAFALDRLTAAGELDAAAAHLLVWARNLTRWIGVHAAGDDEPQADAVLRRELANLRAAWRLARTGGHLDVAVAIVASLALPAEWRDLPEIRGWAEELADDPALAAHPGAALVLATAARAAYMRGDPATTERRARAGLERATEDDARGRGLRALALARLTRGEFAEVVDLELAAAPLGAGPNGGLGIAALAATYAGDPARARSFHEGMTAHAVFPTLRAFTAYVGAEIDSADGRLDAAESQYLRAIELARSSGATFVVNIASVGLITVLSRGGRTEDALRGYRDVIEYFSSTGNWSHLWTTLRNLADLLRALDDPAAAAQLDAAGDHAPALRVAREAIDRHLAGPLGW